MANSENSPNENETPFEKNTNCLWHFTSQVGLAPILLSDDGFLAGHTSFMSDPEDCILRDHLWANLVKVVKGTPQEGSQEEKIHSAVEERIEAGAFFPIFVACFTTDVCEKAMWTSRTQNGGFAIGFDKEKLIADIKQHSKDVLVTDCDYDTFEENTIKCNELEKEISEFAKQHQDDKARLAEFIKLKTKCQKLVACKRKPLEWEKEIRVVYSFQAAPPRERIRYLGSRPFVTMPLETHIRNYVKYIVVSPFGTVRQSRVLANFIASAIGKGPDIVKEMDYSISPRM